MSFIVAIDGPAGTGKGTITKLVSEELGLINIDTGAMYRCVALEALKNNIKETEIERVENILKNIEIKFKRKNGDILVFLNGQDVTKEIRTPEGTAVFPNADVKIYLDASIEERAIRRYKQNLEKGINQTYEEVLESIRQRHILETTRDINPLRKADDAILVDTTELSIKQVKDRVIEIIKEKLHD